MTKQILLYHVAKYQQPGVPKNILGILGEGLKRDQKGEVSTQNDQEKKEEGSIISGLHFE